MAKSNGHNRKAHREKGSTRDENRSINKIKKDQNAALDRYVLQGASISPLLQRWVLIPPKPSGHSEMQKSYRSEVPIANEANARQRYLCEGLDAPELEDLRFRA
jgi:hypothetical protein